MDGRKSKKSAGNVQALVLLLPLLFLQVWQSPDPSRTLDLLRSATQTYIATRRSNQRRGIHTKWKLEDETAKVKHSSEKSAGVIQVQFH